VFGKKTFNTRVAAGRRPVGIPERDWDERRVEFVTSDGDVIWAGPASRMPRRIEYHGRKGWRIRW